VGRTVSPLDFANVAETDADSPMRISATDWRRCRKNFVVRRSDAMSPADVSFIADFGILSAIKDESVGSCRGSRLISLLRTLLLPGPLSRNYSLLFEPVKPTFKCQISRNQINYPDRNILSAARLVKVRAGALRHCRSMFINDIAFRAYRVNCLGKMHRG
jgi:hypothetical protein